MAHAQVDSKSISSTLPQLPAQRAEGQGQHAQGEDQTAGEAAEKRFFSIIPRLTVEGEWADNVRLQSSANKESDFVTTVRPGIRFVADGDRLKANVDYSLRRMYYARDESLNRSQNSLNAAGSYELAENFAFIDFNGTISQQTISAFGPSANNDVAFNANSTEVATYRLSPYVRGQFGDWANYQARYSRVMTRSKSNSAFSYDMNEWSALLSGTSQLRGVDWSLDLNRQDLNYNNGRAFASDRVRLILTHPVSPQLRFALIPGWESNNYASPDKESRATIGGQVNWAVSDRTDVSALVEKRFFGRAHSLSFEHRTPRTAWRASDSRDASLMPNQVGTATLGPLADLLFFQFSSVEPDPVRRAQLVQSFLVANGLDGNTNVNLGFLTSAVSLVRRQNASFSLLGARSTLTFLASRTETSRLLQSSGSLDDLGNTQFVRQNGFSIVYSHRLTPLSTFNALAMQTRSVGQSNLGLTMKTLNVSVSTQLGKNVTGTVGLRRIISNGSLLSYTESAVRGGITVQF